MQGGIILSTYNDAYFKLDPRTKLLLMIVINIVIFSGGALQYTGIMATIPILLLASSKKVKSAVKAGIMLGISAIGYVYLVPLVHGILNILVVMVAYTIYRLMPGFIMGYYLVSTTTVSEFVASMERMHISQNIIIPLSVMFRFFPTVGEEMHAIGDAMHMRDIGFMSGNFVKKPFLTIEYCLVPMLMSAVKIGDELSASSLTRGLGSPVKRTNICSIGFHIQDVCVLSIASLALIGSVVI